MIAEIVSNGMLSLPSALAVVGEMHFIAPNSTRNFGFTYDLKGIVPAVILIIFFGVFALYTAKLLIDFKVSIHNFCKTRQPPTLLPS